MEASVREWVAAVVGLVLFATINAVQSVTAAISSTVGCAVAMVRWKIAAEMVNWRTQLLMAALVVIALMIGFVVGALTGITMASWPSPSPPPSVVPRPGPYLYRNAPVPPPTRLAAAPSPAGSLNRLAEDASILLELFSQGSHNNDNISDEYHGIITNAIEGVLAIHARIRQVNERAVPRGVSIPDPDCIICYGERADTLFMPCKHLVVCTVYMSRARRWSSVVAANRVVRAVVWWEDEGECQGGVGTVSGV